jgi:hypothetical protein
LFIEPRGSFGGFHLNRIAILNFKFLLYFNIHIPINNFYRYCDIILEFQIFFRYLKL